MGAVARRLGVPLRPSERDRPQRVAILVLACASHPYDRLISTVRRTWASRLLSGVDIYYVYGNPEPGPRAEVLSRYFAGDLPEVEPGAIHREGDILIAGCADTIDEQEDCLLRKRLTAFGYLSEQDEYDQIYTVCAASYVDLDHLRRYADSMPYRRTVSGRIGVDLTGTAPFISGASMLLTVDVARELSNNSEAIIDENQFGFRDDVTIGHWIASNLSKVPIDQVIKDVEEVSRFTRKHVFRPTEEREVDFVSTPQENQRPSPGAYHYHFHSKGSDQMVRFHARYFRRTGKCAQEWPVASS
jgi:hypothetical protein